MTFFVYFSKTKPVLSDNPSRTCWRANCSFFTKTLTSCKVLVRIFFQTSNSSNVFNGEFQNNSSGGFRFRFVYFLLKMVWGNTTLLVLAFMFLEAEKWPLRNVHITVEWESICNIASDLASMEHLF